MLARAVLLPRAPTLGRRLASTRHKARRARSSTTTTTTTPIAPDADPTASKKKTVRRVVLTGAVALITVVGAITGARLKSDRDQVKRHQEVQELPLDERIAMLEDRRSGLVSMRMPIEVKLVGLRERMAAEVEAEKKKKEEERAEGTA